MSGYDGVANLLIQKGVDLNVINEDGRTALMYAALVDPSKEKNSYRILRIRNKI